jgi:hypothetical protein
MILFNFFISSSHVASLVRNCDRDASSGFGILPCSALFTTE